MALLLTLALFSGNLCLVKSAFHAEGAIGAEPAPVSVGAYDPIILHMLSNEGITPASSFTYRILNGTYCAISGYTGSETEIVIPSELGGYIVQSIDSNVFQN